MARVPKLSLRGKLRYAAPVAGGALGAGTLGAAIGHDVGEANWRKKKGDKKTFKRNAVLKGLGIGAAVGAGAGGVGSAGRYLKNRANLGTRQASFKRFTDAVNQQKARATQEAGSNFDRTYRFNRPADADEATWSRFQSARQADRSSFTSRAERHADSPIWRNSRKSDLDDDIQKFKDGKSVFRSWTRAKPTYFAPGDPSSWDMRETRRAWDGVVNDRASELAKHLRAQGVSPSMAELRAAQFRSAQSLRGLRGGVNFDQQWRDLQRDFAEAKNYRASSGGSRGSDDWRRTYGGGSSGGGRSGWGSGGRGSTPPRSSVNVAPLSKAFGVDLKGVKTKKEVKRAYRAWAMKNHPDRGGSTAEFQRVQGLFDSYKSSPDFEKLAYLRELSFLFRQG